MLAPPTAITFFSVTTNAAPTTTSSGSTPAGTSWTNCPSASGSALSGTSCGTLDVSPDFNSVPAFVGTTVLSLCQCSRFSASQCSVCQSLSYQALTKECSLWLYSVSAVQGMPGKMAQEQRWPSSTRSALSAARPPRLDSFHLVLPLFPTPHPLLVPHLLRLRLPRPPPPLPPPRIISPTHTPSTCPGVAPAPAPSPLTQSLSCGLIGFGTNFVNAYALYSTHSVATCAMDCFANAACNSFGFGSAY